MDQERSFKKVSMRLNAELIAADITDGLAAEFEKASAEVRLCEQLFFIVAKQLTHFQSLMRGGSKAYRHRRSFPCGAEAVVKFQHYRKVTVMSVKWQQACCCATDEQKLQCQDAFQQWLSEIEQREVKAKHFRFHHEDSPLFKLDPDRTLILPARRLPTMDTKLS